MKARHRHLLTFGALGLVMPASADVIYSNLQDIAIPATFDGLYLNVETGAWNTPSNLGAGVAGWDVNPFSGGKAFANSPDFQPVRSGTTSSSPILNLAAGVTVGSGSVFSTFTWDDDNNVNTPQVPGYGGSQMLTGLGGNFTDGTEGYIGFRLNGTDYGSMRVVLTNNTSGAMIRDWAYDDTGAAIKTGWIKTDIVSPTARTVTLNPGTGEAFTLGSVLADASGSISNSVLKTGDGTTVLSQTNTYTGATSVNAGKLVVSGSIATGAVTVAAGTATGTPLATLGGSGNGTTTGMIGGNVSLTAESSTGFKNGGVLAPTAAASGTKLSVAGTTTFGTGSIFEWDMSATTPGTDPGVVSNSGSYGQLAGTGTISSTSSDAVFKIVHGAGNAFTDAFWDSDKSWTNIFTGAGATNTLASIFSSISGAGLTWADNKAAFGNINPGGDGGYFTFSGTSTLNWTAVPEPTSALAGLLLGAGLLRRR